MSAPQRTRCLIFTPACCRRGAVLALLFATTMLASAEAPLRSVIHLEQVVAALDASGLSLASAGVHLLAENLATIVEPRLEVRGFEPWGDRGAQVRMGCVVHEQCLPFYVAVSWANPEAAGTALHAKGALNPGQMPRRTPVQQSLAAGLSEVSGSVTAARPSPIAASNAESISRATEASVHAGARATLLIDGGRLHIKVPVICLENGSSGRTIRVTALDHRQTYRAEVIDSTLLKGTL